MAFYHPHVYYYVLIVHMFNMKKMYTILLLYCYYLLYFSSYDFFSLKCVENKILKIVVFYIMNNNNFYLHISYYSDSRGIQ